MLFNEYYWNNKIKEYGRGEMHTTSENLNGSHLQEDLGVDGRIILKWVLNKISGCLWIHVAQDRDRWLALVNTVMNIWVPLKWRIS
jgi:hypothetical protein